MLLRYSREGHSLVVACELSGLNEGTVRNRMLDDDELHDKVSRAREDGHKHSRQDVLDGLRTKALDPLARDGVKAAAVFLQVTGDVKADEPEHPITNVNVLIADQRTLEAYRTLRAAVYAEPGGPSANGPERMGDAGVQRILEA